MSRLHLNHILNDHNNMPKTYWIAKTESNGTAYISIGKLRIPKAYLGKRLRLRLEVKVL